MELTKGRYRYTLYLLALLVLAGIAPVAADDTFVEAPLPSRSDFHFAGDVKQVVPSTGSVSVLVVFAQFSDEAENGNQIPSFTADLFAPDLPGSFTHFYATMSAGLLQVQGTVLPRYYTSRRPASAYLAASAEENGLFGEFVEEILRQVDSDYDLSQFDNDGPDGTPNSGDDDGLVDYLFVCLRSAPTNFIIGHADGIARLGFEEDFLSADLAGNGEAIRVADGYGSILKTQSFAWTVGAMAHEFGHALGLPDLNDKSHLDNSKQGDAEYSAGIGRWGLMGWGALGWQKDGRADGPGPFCAWSLAQLGWLGRDNERMVELIQDAAALPMEDLFAGGTVYKVPLRTEFGRRSRVPLTGDMHAEYLLLEQRRRNSHYYNRHQPCEGVLVWHVRGSGINNNDERHKLVDLVSADGLFGDGGYGIGLDPQPRQGFDNLDFWAKNQAYRSSYGGNQGDSTDAFDGARYARLDHTSNPSSYLFGETSAAYIPVQIRFVRQDSQTLSASIELPYWAGTIREEVDWLGQVRVGGDLIIAPEGRLTIHPSTRVIIMGEDRLQAGLDPQLVEIIVDGNLDFLDTYQLYRHEPEIAEREFVPIQPVVFATQSPGQAWYGIYGEVELDPNQAVQQRAEGDLAASEGQNRITAVEDVRLETAQMDTFELLPNYPNPFSSQTTLPYTLPEPAEVHLTILNSLGQIVQSLVRSHKMEGAQTASWAGQAQSGQRVGSGVYFAELKIPGRFVQRRKMMFLVGGFSQVDQLDERLRQQGQGWEALEMDLTAPQKTYGGIANSQQTQVGFTLGVHWVRLQVFKHFIESPNRHRAYAAQLQVLAPLLPATRTELDRFNAHVQALGESDAAEPGLAVVRKELEKLIQSGEGIAAPYFYLGEWLENVRLAALGARRLSLPLEQLSQPAADAVAGRQLRALLDQENADPNVLEALARLEAALDAAPQTRQEIVALVELVENINDLLMLR